MEDGTKKSFDHGDFFPRRHMFGQIIRRPHDAGHLRKFRRLQGEAADAHPAGGAIHIHAGHHDDKKHDHHSAAPDHAPPSDPRLRRMGHHQSGGGTKREVDQMIFQIGIGRGPQFDVHIVRGAIHIDGPDGNQHARHDEHPFQRRRDVLPMCQGRLATRRHMRFPFLENFSSYSVSTSPSTGAAWRS